jgi:Sigma 54 modulation protein / S30EA ribosomal protein
MSTRVLTSSSRENTRAKTQRGRVRTRDSKERAASTGRFPKASGRNPVRMHEPLIHAHIRVLGIDLNQDTRTSIRRRLDRKLKKFARSIERVSVRLKDVNGPRGGVDQVCRIKVVLRNLPSVVYEKQDISLDAAVGGALAGAERAVRRTLQRRRSKPIRKRPRTAPVSLTESNKES